MDIIGEDRGEAKKNKKPRKSHKRNVGNKADLTGGQKYVDTSIFSVDANPEDLENKKRAGREA